MQETKLQLDRRDFLQMAAAAAAVGVGATLPAATASAATTDATDFTRWLEGISGKHRVVLDVREPYDGMAIAWAWVWLFTGPQAYGVKESDLGTVMVFRHNAIPFVLEDSMWKKYKLGEYFKINDPQTKAAAVRHPYYTTPVDADVADMTLKNHIERGVKVVACDMAIHYYSGQIAKAQGLKHDDVKKEWMDATLPKIAHAPSGVVACQGAVAKGCAYVFSG
ncbi:MAG: twin-arginine translocation signal domain-containing protein [Pseudomonadota bacterium]|nr:twin-arginine translocation signal domain-containing protein [Pseudomonadota bacterium]